MKRFIFCVWATLVAMSIFAQGEKSLLTSHVNRIQSLSDQGDGTYKNPVIFADFPDPDVIRVDDTYYMVSTTMVNFPGATIVKSKDLVNWEYCAQPLQQLSTSDRYSLLNGENAYASGMWACSMKYHNGRFYILINGNDAGGFLLTATDPEGKWEKRQLSRIYYDPGMLFDNGKVYVACGIGNIQMCELDEDFNYIKEERVISDKSGLEGCHLYKIGDYYYIYATYGGWPSGQAVFRSKNIFGPYEEKLLLNKYINGQPNTIHQGALIDTKSGEWWTILQQDLGALGRMPNLQPVTWKEDWPIIGNNGIPYSIYTKPNVETGSPRVAMPTDDGFRTYPIGMQWQWNHNPNDMAWSLFERPGWLRMKVSGIADRLTQARNMLTQRIYADHDHASQESTGTIRLDVSHLQEGDRAGICILQDPYAAIAVEVKNGKKQLVWWQDQLTTNNNFTPTKKTVTLDIDDIIYLRAAITYSTSKTQFYYSLDNKTFTKLGGQTTLGFNLSVFVGARFGLFCYNGQPSTGYADFDWFSTESNFDEDAFYGAPFEGYSDDMLTIEKIEQGSDELEVMVGNSSPIQLTATFRDGRTEEVATKVLYESSSDAIAVVQNGQVRGVGEGVATISYTYTDPKGNMLTGSFQVRSTYFPFSKEDINTSLFSQGIYDEATHTFKTGENGQMGWVYPNGADMSGYKYLVVKLKQTTSGAHLNLFTDNSIWGNCYATSNFGSDKQIVVNLRSVTYTSGDKKGQILDTKNIRIVAFWANKGTIVVEDMYLTNNNDYSRGEPTSETDETTLNNITVNGKTRSYRLYVPKGCLAGAPLVVAMHGAGGSSNDQSPHFNEIADTAKFIIAYPQGEPIYFPVFGGTVNGWDASGKDNADVAFIKAIIDEVEQNYQIDRNRVYCCGFSNGGMNTYALANACSDLFAAYASISGFPLNEFHLRHTGKRPVPFLHIHGKNDDFVKYSLMPTIVDEMVARLGANPVPVKTSVSGKYDKSVYEAADGSFPYVYYEIDGMGHNDFTTNTEDGNSSLTMWKFFKQYTLDMPYDATLLWRPRIDEEGFAPQEHGWMVNKVTTLLSFGDQNSEESQNVYHSLQFTSGTYKLSFNSEGDIGKTIDIKIRKLPASQLIFEKTVDVNKAVTLFFTVGDEWGEYKITFTRKNRNDNISIKDIRINVSSEEEASGIREHYSQQQQDGKCYSLSGIVIPHPSKGIYIKKGKKYVIK